MMMCGHLADACWNKDILKSNMSFRTDVLRTTTKRGEANREERIASEETRKQGKVYVISITIPVHPRK
jgi:hypothetical protein